MWPEQRTATSLADAIRLAVQMEKMGWLRGRGTVVECWSLTDKLSLSSARLAADR